MSDLFEQLFAPFLKPKNQPEPESQAPADPVQQAKAILDRRLQKHDDDRRDLIRKLKRTYRDDLMRVDEEHYHACSDEYLTFRSTLRAIGMSDHEIDALLRG
jgi:hypothetical protein